MNTELWNKIESFDFDNIPSEYGFTVRLEKENFWTKSFAEQAILEYKKFMYLAASSENMVSPSEIVDIVWHQHLIFTQSYNEFCTLLGKQIQHIPSTHNREDFEKFKRAKERTGKLYESAFGSQPENIWNYNGMFDSLKLEKAKYKIRTFIIAGILLFVAMTVPAYYLLLPLYRKIDNPFFMIGFVTFSILILIGLETYNRIRLRKIVKGADNKSFIFDLHPLELVFCKSQKLSDVINAVVNEMIIKKLIKVHHDHSIEIENDSVTFSSEQEQVKSTLNELGKCYYPVLLSKLANKPVFINKGNSMEAFRKYFNKSKKFGLLFYLNFSVLMILLLGAFTRIVTGVLRDKPVTLIVIATIILSIVIIIFLNRLTYQATSMIVPSMYKKGGLRQRNPTDDWLWKYFLVGSSVLAASFVPIVSYTQRNENNSSCGTSCGSSCGSSCSSCGGCGGD